MPTVDKCTCSIYVHCFCLLGGFFYPLLTISDLKIIIKLSQILLHCSLRMSFFKEKKTMFFSKFDPPTVKLLSNIDFFFFEPSKPLQFPCNLMQSAVFLHLTMTFSTFNICSKQGCRSLPLNIIPALYFYRLFSKLLYSLTACAV